MKAYYKIQNVGSIFAGSEQYVPLSALFKNLTEIQNEGMISEFDVTRSTLEQVFQAFARFQVARNAYEPRNVNMMPEETVDGITMTQSQGQIVPEEIVIENPIEINEMGTINKAQQ